MLQILTSVNKQTTAAIICALILMAAILAYVMAISEELLTKNIAFVSNHILMASINVMFVNDT